MVDNNKHLWGELTNHQKEMVYNMGPNFQLRTNTQFVAIYCRVSRLGLHNSLDEAIMSQLSNLREIAIRNNWVTEEFVEVESGINNNRNEFNKLIENINSYDAILVTDLDRISRDADYSKDVKKLCIDHDVLIYTTNGEFNLVNNDHVLHYNIVHAFSEYERKKIISRLNRGRASKASEGKVVSRSPFGYAKNHVTQRFEIVEDNAKVVRTIFELFKDGRTEYKIAKELNTMGYKSPTGKEITKDFIKLVLQNRTYCGDYEYNYNDYNGWGINTIRHENHHEPIVSKEEFERVQQLFKQKQNSSKRRMGNKEKRRLEGLIVCEVCNTTRYVTLDISGVYYLKKCEICKDAGCKYDIIEKEVMDTIKSLGPTLRVELEKLYGIDNNKNKKAIGEKLNGIKKRLKQLNQGKISLIYMRTQKEITKEEFDESKKVLDKEMMDAKVLKEQLTLQLRNLKPNNTGECVNFIQTLENVESLRVDAVCQFVRSFVKEIRFCRNITGNTNTANRNRIKHTLKIEPFVSSDVNPDSNAS